MTSNQINWLNYQETSRSNRAREVETNRSNLANETETNRANLAREAETHRSNLANETETNRSNLAREAETSLHNRTTEAETNRSNLANEAIQRENSQRQARTSMSVAKTQAQASKYAADSAARTGRYSADRSSAATRYSADSSRAASAYAANTAAAASKYAQDVQSLDKYRQRLSDTAQRGYDRASKKEIAQLNNDAQKALKSIDSMQKQLDRNSNEYIALQRLKEQIRKNDKDFGIDLANTIIKGLSMVLEGVNTAGGLAEKAAKYKLRG